MVNGVLLYSTFPPSVKAQSALQKKFYSPMRTHIHALMAFGVLPNDTLTSRQVSEPNLRSSSQRLPQHAINERPHQADTGSVLQVTPLERFS